MYIPDLTAYAIVGTTAALVVFDVIVAVYYGGRGTISAVLLAAARAVSLLPFGFGVLMGHLFVPNGSKNIPVLLGISFYVAALDAWRRARFEINPAWPLILGIVAGHFFWSQF